jgi:hypothetical protein
LCLAARALEKNHASLARRTTCAYALSLLVSLVLCAIRNGPGAPNLFFLINHPDEDQSPVMIIGE